jgi:hypothetical protein
MEDGESIPIENVGAAILKRTGFNLNHSIFVSSNKLLTNAVP